MPKLDELLPSLVATVLKKPISLGNQSDDPPMSRAQLDQWVKDNADAWDADEPARKQA